MVFMLGLSVLALGLGLAPTPSPPLGNEPGMAVVVAADPELSGTNVGAGDPRRLPAPPNAAMERLG